MAPEPDPTPSDDLDRLGGMARGGEEEGLGLELVVVEVWMVGEGAAREAEVSEVKAAMRDLRPANIAPWPEATRGLMMSPHEA